MAATPDTQTAVDWPNIRDQAAAFITTEYASLDRHGAPITWPVTPYRGSDGRTIDITTGLTYPLKAERARRNPKVSLSFSQPLGSGLADPAVFVIQGLATVRDADLLANSARYLSEAAERLPDACDNIPTAMLRRMAWYWTRIWIEVSPVRVLWWPGEISGSLRSCGSSRSRSPPSRRIPSRSGAAPGPGTPAHRWTGRRGYAVRSTGSACRC